MNSIHLAGSEDVRAAGSVMRQAAVEMNAASSNMRDALEQHQRFLQQWLEDFRAIMEKR